MTALTVADRVIALAEHLSGREASRDSKLGDDLALDSLDCVQLAIDIERQFDIVIPDSDVDNPALGVMSGLIEYVERAVAHRDLYQKRVVDGRTTYERPGAEL
jgi:acyl carrier protein